MVTACVRVARQFLRRRRGPAVAEPRRAQGRRRARHDRAALHRHARHTKPRSSGCAIPRSEVSVALRRAARTATSSRCVPEERARLARRRSRPGPARPTSIRARSASRSPIPATTTAIRIFPSAQIAAVTALCRSILTRHTIPPDRVLAHSDVAPARKQDPGEKFPWQLLARFRRSACGSSRRRSSTGPIFVLGDTRRRRSKSCRSCSRDYGYGVEPTGYFDGATRDASRAFQRHFRPARVDGVADVSTLDDAASAAADRDAKLQPGRAGSTGARHCAGP